MLCSHQEFWAKDRSRQQAGAGLGATCQKEWREAGVPGLTESCLTRNSAHVLSIPYIIEQHAEEWRQKLLADIILWAACAIAGVVSCTGHGVLTSLWLAKLCVCVVCDRLFEQGHLPKIYGTNRHHLSGAATYLQQTLALYQSPH